ncbi:hypothetical protein N658DRAFT_431925, partial [Parathielavia hyrcaniae]
KVSQRAMDVVEMLFFHDSAHDHAGEMEWKGFLHFMVEIGFSAENLYGSAWNFTPAGENLLTSLTRRKIMIHGPHPVPKLPF